MAFGAIVSEKLVQVNGVVRVPTGLCLVALQSGTTPTRWIRGLLCVGGACTFVVALRSGTTAVTSLRKQTYSVRWPLSPCMSRLISCDVRELSLSVRLPDRPSALESLLIFQRRFALGMVLRVWVLCLWIRTGGLLKPWWGSCVVEHRRWPVFPGLGR